MEERLVEIGREILRFAQNDEWTAARGAAR